MEVIRSLSIFLIALLVSLFMVPLLQRWAVDTGVVDLPDERKLHQGAIPRIGGVAIAMSWLFSLLLHLDLAREIRGIMAGALVMFATGLIDDRYGLSPRRKLMGQSIACLVVVVVGGLRIHTLGDLTGAGPILLPAWLGIPFTLFCMVGVANAINLMDGLDGLAGGVSAVALGAFAILGFLDGNSLVMAVSVALLGGIVGFLRFNLHPARIFMGDSGSLVVGFIIACLAILSTQTAGAVASPVVPLLLLGLPIADTVLVMVRRIQRRSSPFAADRTHVHHRLLDLGLEHRHAVMTLVGFSLLMAASALVLRQLEEERLLLSGYAAGMTVFYLAIGMLRARRDRLPGIGCVDGSALPGTLHKGMVMFLALKTCVKPGTTRYQMLFGSVLALFVSLMVLLVVNVARARGI